MKYSPHPPFGGVHIHLALPALLDRLARIPACLTLISQSSKDRFFHLCTTQYVICWKYSLRIGGMCTLYTFEVHTRPACQNTPACLTLISQGSMELVQVVHVVNGFSIFFCKPFFPTFFFFFIYETLHYWLRGDMGKKGAKNWQK